MDKSTIEDSLAKALEKRRGIKVVTTSSKSGTRISHSIWFVQKDGKLYLLPVRGSDSHWYNNVLAELDIALRAPGSPAGETSVR